MAAPATSDTVTAVDLLKADNERLNGEVAKLTAKLEKFADYGDLIKERDKLKAEVGTPDEWRKRAEDAQGELRTMRHKQAFAQHAEAEGVARDEIDDLYTLSGYKAERDDIDEAALKTLIADQKKTRPRFFQPPADSASTPTPTPTSTQQKPVPGQGRGAHHDTSKSGITLTEEQLADPKFMLDPRNKALLYGSKK
jgi:hypothetical protein